MKLHIPERVIGIVIVRTNGNCIINHIIAVHCMMLFVRCSYHLHDILENCWNIGIARSANAACELLLVLVHGIIFG